MELSLALQESQRLITAWQTPLLFVVVQFLIVLLFFVGHSSSSAEAAAGLEGEEPLADFWSSIYMPSPLLRLPTFSASAATLPSVVVQGLRKWARRAACHVNSAAPSSLSSIPAPGLEENLFSNPEL